MNSKSQNTKGRVARVDKESCLVLNEEQSIQELIFMDTGAVSWKGKELVVGDFVTLKDQNLVELLPRKTMLWRQDPSNPEKPQVIAANMDVIALVQGLDQKLSIPRIERELVMVAESGAVPEIILSKADLVEPDYIQECLNQLKEELLLTKPVLVTSSLTNQNIPEFEKLLVSNKTMVLLGLSGVGKSSLVNTLMAHATQKTAEVRKADSRGRHATVARSLIPLPQGGYIIDTPGLRVFGLIGGNKDGQGIDAVFTEIAKSAQKCKFKDCAHQKEPDCAVKADIQSGAISGARLERYQQLKEELSS